MTLKLIFKRRSLALSYNCSSDIKEKVLFVTKNDLASEKNIAQINLGRYLF